MIIHYAFRIHQGSRRCIFILLRLFDLSSIQLRRLIPTWGQRRPTPTNRTRPSKKKTIEERHSTTPVPTTTELPFLPYRSISPISESITQSLHEINLIRANRSVLSQTRILDNVISQMTTVRRTSTQAVSQRAT